MSVRWGFELSLSQLNCVASPWFLCDGIWGFPQSLVLLGSQPFGRGQTPCACSLARCWMNLLVKVFIIWLISIKTQIFHCLTICWPAFDKICQLEPCSPFLGLSSLDTLLPFHLPHCRKDSSSFWNFCAMGNRKFSIVELLLPLFLFSLFHCFFLFLF